MRKENILYIVVPCYNEEAVLWQTSEALDAVMKRMTSSGKISDQSRVVFVDDGSKDNTWELISAIASQSPLFSGIKLARNKGHQNALLAGLFFAKEHADMVISMDADLQDDVDAAERMVDEYHNGCEIVYGVRCSREKDTFFKRFTAEGFYKFMKLLGVDIVYNHADYRLMSKTALEALSKYNEVNMFLRGVVPLIGYKTANVEYERGERAAGESKYPLKKMLAFAAEGITSFSVKPLKMITASGFIIFAAAVAALLYTLIVKLCGATVAGWSSLAASVWLLGGLTLLALGIVGEYVGKIYSEVKQRPRYEIETVIHAEPKKRQKLDTKVIDLLLNRRSIRAYEKRPVSHAILETIVECGRFAPSAMGKQPWHFTVIETRDILDAISMANKAIIMRSDDEARKAAASAADFDCFRGAPCAIIVSGDDSNEYSDIDCANACQNMIIAAESLGISSCYLASFKPALLAPSGKKLLTALGLPEGYSPRIAVALGYGAETPKDRAPRAEDSVDYIK